jgi:hypothetical protein
MDFVNRRKQMKNEIEIVHLPGYYIKASGIGRIHAMKDGSWQGCINGHYVRLPNENSAIEYFSTAVALVAVSSI